MRRFALFALLFSLCLVTVRAQTPLYPAKYTVTSGSPFPALPAAATMRGRVVNVVDALAPGNCTTGGGTYETPCVSDGTNWVPWGALGSGTGTVTNVTATLPNHSSGGATPDISIDNAAADGSTKGAASFTPADFNSSSGNISLDYTNGQAADASHKGFLTSTDWSTFNGKQNALGYTPLNPANNLSDLANAGTSRSNLGGTTVGQNLFTLTNPSAVNWLRINADNSVSTRSAAQTLSDIGAQASGNYLVDCGSNGFLARSTLNTSVCRTLTGTSNRLTISNTTGGGDPVFNVPDSAQLNVSKLVNLTGNGFVKTSGGDGSLSIDTGSYVPTSRSLTAGAGLTGGGDLSADRTFTVGAGAGITVNADDVALTPPGTLTVSSSNSASGNHTHAITSSSNPGAAASILATDSSGYLTTVRHTVTDYLFVNNSTANLYLKDTSTGFQASSTTVINPQSGNTLRNTSYQSGLQGWNVSDGGNAEFNNIDVRGAIHAAVIVYNAQLATAGTLGVFKSACKLKNSATVPTSPTYGTTTVSIDCVDQDGLTHASSQLFVLNDVLQLKDGILGNTWFQVQSASDQTTFWRYTAVLLAGTSSVVYRDGLGVANYGPAGSGFIVQTADQTNAPYLQMATHQASVSSSNSSGSLVVTPQLRLGNLNGSYGYATDVYGLGAGQYGSASKTWFTIEQTNGLRFGNNTTQLFNIDTSGNILTGRTGSGQSNVYITSGAVDLRNNTTPRIHLASDGSGYLANSSISWDTSGNLTVTGNSTLGGWTIGSTTITGGSIALDSAGAIYAGATSTLAGNGWWLDYNSGTPRARVGTVSAGALVKGFYWNGSNLEIKGTNFTLDSSGNITATGGTIGGWAINSAYLAKDTGTNGTSAGMAPSDYPFFAGATYANRASAAFRVTPAGVVTASSGNVILDSFGVNIYNGAFQTVNPGLTSYDGVFLGSSGNAAASGYSSRLRLESTAGNGSESHTVDYIVESQSAFKTGNLVISSAYDGGTYYPTLRISSSNLGNGGTTLYARDAATNTSSNSLVLTHNSSGTPAASFGTGIFFQGDSASVADRSMATIQSLWTTATDASRTSAVVVQTVNGAGSLAEVARFAGNGDLTLTGLIKAGSGATTLTDAAGNLLASALTGSIADARLSANVVLKNAANTFTGSPQELASAKLLMSGTASFGSALTVTAQVYRNTTSGLVMAGAGNSTDVLVTNKGGSTVFEVPTGTTLMVLGSGLQYTTGSKPTCNAAARGTSWYVAGASSVKDTFEVCGKDASDAYAWRTIY